MILTLGQFLEQTDIGKEEWTIGSMWKHGTKCRNGKIKIPFWCNRTELYACYIRNIVLPCHEIFLCTKNVDLFITAYETTDKEKTIHLLKQIGDINGNNLIPIQLCTLRNIVRWDDIVDISNEYQQLSVMNEKCDFMVKAWYVVDNMLFVRRAETDVKDATLKHVIKSYSKDPQIYNDVIVKHGGDKHTMTLTLRQFLENTDAGKEEWKLEPYFQSNLKLQNGQINEKFWQNYEYLYGYYVKQIILSVHEVWLSKEYTECSIYENHEVDRRTTINLIKQVSLLNNNQYSQMELYQLKNMARWYDVIEFNGNGQQKSVINDKYNFTVHSWYIIGETLFVERYTDNLISSVKDMTLLQVITTYYNDKSVCTGMIIEKDNKSIWCTWAHIEKVSKYYTDKVIKITKDTDKYVLRIKLEDSKKEYNYMDKKCTLKTYLKNEKLDKQIILIDDRDTISCDVSDVLQYDDYKKYGEYIVNDVEYGDLPIFYIEKTKNDTESKKTIDISINKNDVEKLKNALADMKDVVSKIPDTQFVMPVKQGVITDNKKNDLETELHDIIGLMCSEDYKDRFKAEYLQLKMRYNKLHRMVVKYEANKLEFKPSCDIELLKKQKAAMGNYLYCLEVRAQVEGIDLK